MLRFSVIKILIPLFFLLISSEVFAGQDNIRFSTLGLRDGLSQQNVRAIHQDSRGFMWFGTQEGLNQFDGYKFTVFSNNPNNPDSLASSFIYEIAETTNGDLWIATDSGVAKLNQDSLAFKNYKNLPSESGESVSDTKSIFVSSDDRIWAGTAGGLNVYDPVQDTFVSVPIVGTVDEKPKLVSAIAEDIGGGIWFAVAYHGLFRLNPVTQEVELFASTLEEGSAIIDPRITKLMIDRNQTIWIGTLNQGLLTLDLSQTAASSVKFTKIPELQEYMTLSLHQDRQERIWVGTDKGLFILNQNEDTLIKLTHDSNDQQSIADNRISSIYQDSGEVIWVGTYRGLSKWNTATAKFDYYRSKSGAINSLSNPNINAITEDHDKKIWIGTFAGLNRLSLSDKSIEQILHDEESPSAILENNVTALNTQNSDLWIGYRTKGLSKFDLNSGTFTHYAASRDDPNSLGANGVTSILSTNTGTLWVATFNGGLNKYLPQSDNFERVLHNNEDSNTISSNRVISLFEDSTGLLWLGTWDAGLNLYDPISKSNIRFLADENTPKSLGSNQVWVIHEDKKGNIWIGTQGTGLNLLSAENRQNGNYEFELFGRDSGLPSSVVYGILEDEEGYLWLSTNRGLTKFDTETKQILNYDSSHGLQGDEFNAGAYHKTSDGQLIFGGTNGVTAFYPENISPNNHVLPVVITRFQRLNDVNNLGSASDKTNKIEISHKDYLVAFEFAGLDYASPMNNQYAYKLEGFDNDWIEARDIRKATYTNLPAGTYRFRVKASNNDGVWNEEGTDVLLTVLPAPWFSWWAYTIYSIILIGITFLTYRGYMAKLREKEAYQKKLEAEVQKRTFELSDANEKLLSASITDQLTGIYNRRYLANRISSDCEAILNAFIAHHAPCDKEFQSGPRLSILMFDLDGFKPINDTYGHDVGDKVIIKVCELLKKVCRDDDIIVRWGGDEFLVMSTIKHLNESSILAERIRTVIQAHEFNIGEDKSVRLSSSIGFACYPFMHNNPKALSWEQTQLLADKALYKAKDAGRNAWVGLLENEQTPSVSNPLILVGDIEKALNSGLLDIVSTR